MKSALLLFIFIFGVLHPAEARWFTGLVAARLHADFRNVDLDAANKADISGGLELIGMQFGYENMSPSNFGTELSLAVLGTNSQSLYPDPNWGTPWFYKFTAKANYLSSSGLYGFIGGDLIGNIYKAESYYFGPGIVFGIGYKLKERFSLALGGTNNSVLFAIDTNKRFLRGQTSELNYHF